MASQRETFEVKPEHLTLLKSANVDWHTCEWGAPQINGKRPYGNSSIYQDLAELLGVKSLRSDEFVITEADARTSRKEGLGAVPFRQK